MARGPTDLLTIPGDTGLGEEAEEGTEVFRVVRGEVSLDAG